MLEIKGKENTAICYTSLLEKTAQEQIQTLCDTKEFFDCKIRIMPDVHAGMGCTIGTTMTITDKIVPGMVGVDIGCGMETALIDAKELDLERLDKCIHKFVPAGFNVHRKRRAMSDEIDLSILRCAPHVNTDRAYKSIGTLGGGNHFIEVDRSDSGDLYIVVHSGSRHLGSQVAEYYQEEAYKTLCGNGKKQIEDTIEKLKYENRELEIQNTIETLNKQYNTHLPKELTYVEGVLFDDYMHDMQIIQQFAVLNRKAIMKTILTGMRLSIVEAFTTIHNYIDTNYMILRKGAVSAKKDEKLLIPINMRDGSLICKGKGNPDWNFSAPHGAGRLMSRSKAFKELDLEKFKLEMDGIYSSCISKNTLDESPMAYKPMEEILRQIEPTVDIIEKIKPIYNFKSAEGLGRKK